MSVHAFLGLGSNVGDRLETLQRAVRLLEATPGVGVVASSRVYETEPVGGVEQPDFLNAVIEVETDLPARELLDACLAVEARLGRVREVRWGPRTLDVDVLLFDREAIDEPGLTVPHERLHERSFALLPLLELEPNPVMAGGRLAADARPGGDVRPWGAPLSVGAKKPRS